MLQHKEELQGVYVQPDETSKNILCVTVDGANDEGPPMKKSNTSGQETIY